MATSSWMGTVSSPMCQRPGQKTKSATHAAMEGLGSVTLFSVLWQRETDIRNWPKSQGSWGGDRLEILKSMNPSAIRYNNQAMRIYKLPTLTPTGALEKASRQKEVSRFGEVRSS